MGAKTRSSATVLPLSLRVASTCCAAVGQLLGTRPDQLVGARHVGVMLGGDLRALLGDRGLELRLLGLDHLAGTGDPLGHLLVDAGERLLALVLVDAGDDVEREVEDPLQVARADVEQDAEPRRACP